MEILYKIEFLLEIGGEGEILFKNCIRIIKYLYGKNENGYLFYFIVKS